MKKRVRHVRCCGLGKHAGVHRPPLHGCLKRPRGRFKASPDRLGGFFVFRKVREFRCKRHKEILKYLRVGCLTHCREFRAFGFKQCSNFGEPRKEFFVLEHRLPAALRARRGPHVSEDALPAFAEKKPRGEALQSPRERPVCVRRIGFTLRHQPLNMCFRESKAVAPGHKPRVNEREVVCGHLPALLRLRHLKPRFQV